MLNGAQLTVEPGGETLGISALPGSTVLLNGASVAGDNQRALALTESQATINNSTLTSTGNFGLSVIKGVGAVAPGSTALVTNSTISGIGRGLNVSGGSSATLVGSTVNGSGAVGGTVAGNGLGISLVGGEAILRDSSATGSNRAAGLFGSGTDNAAPRLELDNAKLTSLSGSAIVVSNLGTAPMDADILIGNGSTLTAANQTLVEVGLPGEAAGAVTEATITVDASQLTGDILVSDTAVADVFMNNGATLTGTLNNVTSLTMDASHVTGIVNEPAGSSASVTLSNGASFQGNLNNLGSLSLDASSVTGNVVSASGSQTQISLGNGSSLEGSVINASRLSLDRSTLTGEVNQDAQTPGALSLNNQARLFGTVRNASSMTIDATSTFAMVNDSSVGALTLNGGTVDLRAGQGAFRTLTATSLAGAGTFALGTDLAGHLSDLVNIEGQAQGQHALRIQNTGVDPVQGDLPQRVVHTEGGAAQFAVQGEVVDQGTYSYQLEQRDTDWYLVQDTSTGPIVSPSAQAAIGLFSAAPTVWYGELSTLRSRMGELRDGRDQGGAWLRTYGNRYQISTADQVNYKQTQQGISFGVDMPLPSADGQWLVGVMGGYSDSTLNMELGSDGRVDSYYLGLYSTWLASSGFYVDAVIKANRFANKADVRMSDGEKAQGDYDTYGVGGSVELGKHIKLDDGWFVEPYTQVAALWVDGEHYRMDNGLRASSSKADSLLGKLGTHVGRTFPLSNGGFVQPYVKVAAVHEFARNNEIKVNNATFHDDLSGGRGELGAGIAAQVTDTLQLHADFDYSNGENIEQPWGANLGIRYAW
ncbi:autotransporter outer membrane beta-barrel domain-containing protein [Pseudomonas sp. NPDC089401]|uniref:autotransporter outer membrane beta-barrel domain-containing protein n=1 Tax=Pseudomonas sp. NPDC089401 TaxID=3364462 RepID=UPI0037F73546